MRQHSGRTITKQTTIHATVWPGLHASPSTTIPGSKPKIYHALTWGHSNPHMSTSINWTWPASDCMAAQELHGRADSIKFGHGPLVIDRQQT